MQTKKKKGERERDREREKKKKERQKWDDDLFVIKFDGCTGLHHFCHLSLASLRGRNSSHQVHIYNSLHLNLDWPIAYHFYIWLLFTNQLRIRLEETARLTRSSQPRWLTELRNDWITASLKLIVPDENSNIVATSTAGGLNGFSTLPWNITTL